ncbi:MAG: N-acetylneuraminate synthase family protein [Desulfamplus sp.]|nr:N-acetylneuraminate synthase family protein [Desulfamplus sp.]
MREGFKDNISAISIDGKSIGQGSTYIIAEIGSNHNGDFELAKELIDAAAAAKVDAVKFQAFRADQHYSKHTPNFTYLDAAGHHQSTYDLIHSLEINRDWHLALMEHSQSRGVTFLSSPCDKEAYQQLQELGMAAFKVASFDLPDVRLIEEMARYGKPLILSTGMADYTDIQTALQTMHSVGNEQAILLQCTSLYPAPVQLSNLASMRTMRQAFGRHVGYSDHTLGDHVCLAAVALGACMLEKHFTLSRKMNGPDHAFAIEPDELALMVQRVRDVEKAMGDGIKNGPRPEEMEMYAKGRRSIHTKRSFKAGEKIHESDLCIKRPGFGISPRLLKEISGMTLQKDIVEDHWISWNDLKDS